MTFYGVKKSVRERTVIFLIQKLYVFKTLKIRFLKHIKLNHYLKNYSFFLKELGEFPTMVRSKACNLEGLSPQQLVEKGEHEEVCNFKIAFPFLDRL